MLWSGTEKIGVLKAVLVAEFQGGLCFKTLVD